MKTKITLLFSLLFFIAFAQKKELKKAEKLFATGDVAGAVTLLENNASLFTGEDPKIATAKTFLDGKIAQANENFELAFEKYTSIKENSAVKVEVAKQMEILTSDIVNSAIADNEQKNYKDSSTKLYLAYRTNPETNIEYLYYAASNAVNGEIYDAALEYYAILKDKKYTGITTKYFVTEAASGNEIEVSETEYGIYSKSKDYSDFREEDSESRFPEIIKNIALIHAQEGNNEKAMAAVKEARANDPEDLSLILTEANLYIKLDEKEKFGELMEQAIAQDPENSVLYFNLGVVNADLGDIEAAKSYYEKAIELDASYEAAYLNLVSLILAGESDIVEEMNNLGTSRADNMRYDVLKKEREDLFKECVPILKSLVDISKNQEAIKTLMNIYGTLGDNEGFMAMKGMVE